MEALDCFILTEDPLKQYENKRKEIVSQEEFLSRLCQFYRCGTERRKRIST
jgi:hypothetical protein